MLAAARGKSFRSDLYQRTTLQSGVRLITAPLRERTSVVVAFMVGVGSRHESSELAGIAHFVEHMVFKGTEKFPTAQVMSEAIEGVGGTLDAATDKELTLVWAQVPAEHLRLALEVLADMVWCPTFDDTEIEKEKQVVVEELRMYVDNPQEHVSTLFEEVFWPNHPLGRDTAGTEHTVMSFTKELCRAHCARFFSPDNVVISIAGACDVDSTRNLVEEVLREKPFPQKGLRSQMVPAPSQWDNGARRVLFLERETEQANIVLGVRGVSYRDDERFVIDVLNTILGEGMSSRLFSEVREVRALAYDVHSSTTKLHDTGALTLYVGCEPGRAEAAAAAAIHELERLAVEPISDEEMKKAHGYLKGRLVVDLESSAALSQYLGQQELLCDEILQPDDVIGRIEAVREDEVRTLAATLLARGLYASIIGPFANATAFERIITG